MVDGTRRYFIALMALARRRCRRLRLSVKGGKEKSHFNFRYCYLPSRFQLELHVRYLTYLTVPPHTYAAVPFGTFALLNCKRTLIGTSGGKEYLKRTQKHTLLSARICTAHLPQSGWIIIFKPFQPGFSFLCDPISPLFTLSIDNMAIQ